VDLFLKDSSATLVLWHVCNFVGFSPFEEIGFSGIDGLLFDRLLFDRLLFDGGGSDNGSFGDGGGIAPNEGKRVGSFVVI